MKRRLTSVAVLVVLLDVLVLNAAWHVAPALSLTAALAAPHVEPMLAPLYAEPRREELAIAGASAPAQIYRPLRAQRSLVLVRDTPRDDDGVAALARMLARRGLLVVVPAGAPDPATLHAYTAALARPVDVAAVSSFDDGSGARSPLSRAAHAWRLLRLSRALTSP